MQYSAQTKTLLGNWSLPLFMTKENKYVTGVVLAFVAVALYLPANHIHIFPPQELPRGWIDMMVPFMPYTVWIYLSEYLFFIAVYMTCKNMTNLNKYFYSFLTLQSVSVLIFWVWPTTYPRDLFPLPDDLGRVTYYLFNTLRMTDTPANCCPSLHVSSVYLSAFIFLNEQRKKFPFFFLWATAVAVSTLTTKQHYVVDVIMGFIMAIATHWIFHKYVTYRPAVIKKRKAKRS
jgi:membrane-associated phospholipid phosphatase